MMFDSKFHVLRLLGWGIAALLLWIAGGVIPVYAQEVRPQGTTQATVSQALLDELAAGDGPVDILILLRSQPDPAAAVAAAHIAEDASPEARRTARLAAVYASLTAHAATTQADLRAWLDSQAVPYRPFYIVNMIQVQGDAALVAALRSRPDVARLDADPEIALRHAPDAPFTAWAAWRDEAEVQANTEILYGLADIRAPEVWADGFRGQGIVIAGQDTGYERDHPALAASYRGRDGEIVTDDYHWLDAAHEPNANDPCAAVAGPCDDSGHGTHTMGTMVGQAGEMIYGVAPAARWIGCRNMLRGVGTPARYTACFEFFLAPYPQGGDPFTQGRPDLAPHVINNSWGCPPREGCNADSLRQVVETVRAAGILVVASAGNDGYLGCSSLVDPIAIYDAALTVGAHNSFAQLAGFSSVGPVTVDGSRRIKPDLTAPGVGIRSALRGGGYGLLSGTSMAAPHVTGAVALLWSAVPDLIGEVDLTEEVLLKSANPVADTRCGGAPGARPNNAFGYGRLDVAAAVDMAQHPWTVALTVTAPISQTPELSGTGVISGAVVNWQDQLTGYVYSTTTRTDGTGVIETLFDGSYTVVVTREQEVCLTTEIDLDRGLVNGRAQPSGLHLECAEPVDPVPGRLFFPILILTAPVTEE